jgi:nucleotide sugar dehydrogenase
MDNISVIGIGKLGLCFALTLEKSGYNVVGVDISQQYIDLINKKQLKSSEQGVEELLSKSKNFKATTSVKEAIDHSNLIFIIVATPSLANGRYDHSQIDGVIQELKNLGQQTEQKHFIVSCTVMPGYCESIRETLNNLNYTVSYNPEFIAQGTILRDQANPDMVLIGEANKQVGDIIQVVYERHVKNQPRYARMTPLEAEMTKLSLNCFLATKIAYANMIGDIVKAAGGDPDIVLSAVGSDTRVGGKYLKYGYGFGGVCIPRDGKALKIFAEDLGLTAKVSEAADLANLIHLDEQVKFFTKENLQKENQIVFDCVTYKPESNLLDESQQLAFAVALAKNGYKILLKERKEVLSKVKEMYGNLFEYEERI